MVVTVLRACCVLFGYEENWENAKRYLLGDIRFLEHLVEFDVTSTPETRFVKVRKDYINKEEFNKESVIK
jgi:hypothetical protein